jgi:hypothetical protein
MMLDGVDVDEKRGPVLDVSDHVKCILDTFVRDLGPFFEFLVVGISIKAKDVERIIRYDSH